MNQVKKYEKITYEISKFYSKSFITDENNAKLLKNLSEFIYKYKLK